jgi:hypothetical protein
MKVYTFSATVKVKNAGGTTMLLKTTVNAEDYYRAKLLLEQQYGRGMLIGTPIRIH